MKKCYLPVVLFLCISPLIYAQNWMLDMRDPRVNFYTVQQEFNDWWAINGQKILNDTTRHEGETEGAWKLYRRWEHQMMPLMVKTGGVRLGAPDPAECNFYQQRQAQQNLRSSANWSYIGPAVSFADGATGTNDSAAGRINCVRFDPVNHNIIYCGAPSGGLWKSTDFGTTWQLLNTDNLPQIGVSDLVINPVNTSTIYIATGDIANAECLSIGVLKSTDGGQTWNTTGLSFTISQGVLIARLLMSPLDSNTLFAATNVGEYKTRDGGVTWSKVNTNGLTGMEFNPANPNTIYIWGTQLYKSVDTGNTWVQLSNGLPDAQASGGFAIGVTPADTACVYVLVSGNTPNPGQSYYPFVGLYRSLNAGDTFTQQCVNPDPSNSSLGSGTQGTYDLNLAVSPVNRDYVVAAAVNSEFSNDGGVTWNSGTAPSHVDHHDIRFFNGSADTVFSADDGGLFMSTDGGNTWHGKNNGLHIGQVYNISSGTHTKSLFLSGRQDDGTLLQDSTSERIVYVGDGLECLIDPLNESRMYASTENGNIGTSTGAGVSLLAYNWGSGVDGPGVWNTPYALENDNSGNIYVAKDFIYKTEDGGASWITLNSPPLTGTDNLYQLLAIAPSNPKYIYAATYTKLYRSADGGATFKNITDGLHGYFTSLAVSPSNPKEVWIGFNGSAAGLLKSVDTGSHFTSFATGLPGSPFYAQCIAPVRDSKDAVYVGLSHGGGVYYRDSTMSNWMPYSGGLPNVTVDQLEIDYCAGKIRAATYGRDIWESDPYVPINVPPTANATFQEGTAGNCSDTIRFTDESNFVPTAWQWYFPGGQPTSSSDQNPVVVYRNGTTYTATFIASNAYGSDTVQYQVPTYNCVGIDQVTNDNVISVYPNPNNGKFILSITGQARGKVNMAVFNNIGESICEYAYTKDSEVMSNECTLSGLARGIYYVRVTTGNTSGVQKLVIEN